MPHVEINRQFRGFEFGVPKESLWLCEPNGDPNPNGRLDGKSHFALQDHRKLVSRNYRFAVLDPIYVAG